MKSFGIPGHSFCLAFAIPDIPFAFLLQTQTLGATTTETEGEKSESKSFLQFAKVFDVDSLCFREVWWYPYGCKTLLKFVICVGVFFSSDFCQFVTSCCPFYVGVFCQFVRKRTIFIFVCFSQLLSTEMKENNQLFAGFV